MFHSGIPTLSQIVAHYERQDFPLLLPAYEETRSPRAEREWSAAIAALQHLLLNVNTEPGAPQGVVLTGPSLVLEEPQLLQQLHLGLFRPESLEAIARQHFQLPAAETETGETFQPSSHDYPLVPHDPLAQEQFCLVFTPKLTLVLALALDEQQQLRFRFSFAPEVIQHCWQALQARLNMTSPHQVKVLSQQIDPFLNQDTTANLVSAFTRQLLHFLPLNTPTVPPVVVPVAVPLTSGAGELDEDACHAEMELLQALTHEIRTPLTTIRMLTRLLLKKRQSQNFTEDVVKRLESIDQECTDQINRMELIFRAAELETQPVDGGDRVQLIPLALQQVIQQHIPHWQKQAQRRRITLDIVLPSQLPAIVSHPALLTQVLAGLMERLTRSLPTGSTVQVNVSTAGNQLKLQFLSQDVALSKSLKSLGQLLMFQPETGSLSLNLDVTKNLFQTLGGKLTVRQRSPQGEELTIFLPLDSYQVSA